MGFALYFHVGSISLESFERFSLNCTQMFLLVRRCVEVMLSFADSRSRSHFKVMGFTLHFLVSSISPEPFERFSFKFHLNVPLSETVCRTHNSAMQSEGQGHTSRSCDLPFLSTPYLQNSLKGFHQISLKMFLSVRWCAETMIQLCRQGQGHTSRS